MYAPLVRQGGFIAFHDIENNPAMPDLEVYRFWEEVSGWRQFEAHEFVDPSIRGKGQGMGIGVLVVQS